MAAVSIVVDVQEVAGPVESRLRVCPDDIRKPGDLADEAEHSGRIQEVHDTREIMRRVGIGLAVARQTMIVEEILEIVPPRCQRLERDLHAFVDRAVLDIEEVLPVVERTCPFRFLHRQR